MLVDRWTDRDPGVGFWQRPVCRVPGAPQSPPRPAQFPREPTCLAIRTCIPVSLCCPQQTALGSLAGALPFLGHFKFFLPPCLEDCSGFIYSLVDLILFPLVRQSPTPSPPHPPFLFIYLEWGGASEKQPLVLYKFLSDIVLKGNFPNGGRGRVIETGPGDSCPPPPKEAAGVQIMQGKVQIFYCV